MQKLLIPTTCLICCVAAAQAAPADTAAALKDALEQEVQLLEGIADAGGVQAALPGLQKALAAQKALFSADEKELWEYLDNTDGVKLPLLELLQRLAAQLTRLEDAAFFDNAELKELLYEQILTDESGAPVEAVPRNS